MNNRGLPVMATACLLSLLLAIRLPAQTRSAFHVRPEAAFQLSPAGPFLLARVHLPPPAARPSLLLPPLQTTDQLPFFCKMEARLERRVSLPLRFRLGSVDYVDELEGKIPAWRDVP